MKRKTLVLRAGTLVTGFCACAQGTFQNLDFEQANVPPDFSTIATTSALPYWTVIAGSFSQQFVSDDWPIEGLTAAALASSPVNVLDGNFSAVLAGFGLNGGWASIAQSGEIPAGSESLRFLALGQLSVFFAGRPLPLQVLGSGPNGSQVYGANISAYAGQYGQLTFQTGPLSSDGVNILDDITFSTQAIPEPGVIPILGLGGLMLSLRRRRRRAAGRWLGPMAFGNPTGLLSRRDSPKTAQRHNAGIGRFCVSPIPKGRLDPPGAQRVIFRVAFGRPFGTWGRLTAKPSVETLGYSRMSLRDKDRRPGQGNFENPLWPGQVSSKKRGTGGLVSACPRTTRISRIQRSHRAATRRLAPAWAGASLALLSKLVLPSVAEAQFDYRTNNGAIIIMDYTGPGGAVTIPGTLGNLPVTSIEQAAFYSRTSLTSVTIPNSVTNIGNFAFEACFSLTNVTVGESVISIGEFAFFYCASLTSVTIPDSVSSIGVEAFSWCGSLSRVTLGANVTAIGEAAFSECGLRNLMLPKSVVSIGAGAFLGCAGLNGVTIANGAASIGDDAFGGCTGLTSVTIPYSVTNLGAQVFQGCSSLTNVMIGEGATSIGEQAFDHSGLTSVAIPNGVTSIGDHAFNACVGLASATIGNGVTNIGEGAFYQCSSLASVTLGPNVSSIGDSAFSESGLASLAIPGSVASIGAGAFASCTELTSITVPGSVTNIGQGAFYGCTSLAAITVSANNPAYSTAAGVLFNRGQTTLIQYPAGNAATSYAIPGGVTSIDDGAFAFCAGLAAISVNASNAAYRSVGGVLFDQGQTALIAYPAGNAATSYAIPAGVTAIGDYAFAGCRSLASVTIPSSVTSIGRSAFYGCSGLPGVTIPGSVTNLGDSAFYGCASLVSVTIAGGVTSLGDSAFYFCPSLTSVYFEGNAPALGAYSYVFFGDEAATIYYLPGTAGWAGFAANTGLTPVLWNPQVQTAGAGFGVRTNQFGFTVSGPADLVVVVEASTSLANPAWQPLGTNTLEGGSFYFSDPRWTNYPARFYRLSMP